MAIALEHLTYTYMPGTPYEAKAVDDISLTLADGEFAGVIGHTGSGKTTLISLIAGLLKPTSGRVLMDGQDINAKGFDRKLLRRSIGVVFQYPEYQLFEETVVKDIAYGPRRTGVAEDEIDGRVHRAMELMEIDCDGIGKLSPFELSGGQKRRVAIAGVLAMNPKVLILDEPVAGLDPKGRTHLMGLITRLNTEGATILMITHSMDDIAEHAKRVLVLSGAKLLMDGMPAQVFSREKELRDIGLDLPAVTRIASLLRAKGADIPQDIITLEALEHAVAGLLGGAL
jgi:energy-coupling factor transport system ATP-binding protein